MSPLTSGEVLTAAPVVLHGDFSTMTRRTSLQLQLPHTPPQTVLENIPPLCCSGSFSLLSYRLPSVSCTVENVLRSENTCIPCATSHVQHTAGACEKTSCTQEVNVGTSCVTKTRRVSFKLATASLVVDLWHKRDACVEAAEASGRGFQKETHLTQVRTWSHDRLSLR